EEDLIEGDQGADAVSLMMGGNIESQTQGKKRRRVGFRMEREASFIRGHLPSRSAEDLTLKKELSTGKILKEKVADLIPLGHGEESMDQIGRKDPSTDQDLENPVQTTEIFDLSAAQQYLSGPWGTEDRRRRILRTERGELSELSLR